MKRGIVIPHDKITEVKQRISDGSHSLRTIARHSGVSFYTVWCVSKGKYDSNKPLQSGRNNDGCMFLESNRNNWLI